MTTISASAAEPFADLSPDLVLDALESQGLKTDGRQLALNSYENRVYQIGIEDDQPLVAKFYRPMRWTDAQIAEEHAFVCSLAEAEIPAVPPIRLQGKTLFEYRGYRFALFARRGGRSPELDQPEVLEWMGRFIGRIHALGAQQPYIHRPTLDLQSFGRAPSDYLLEHGFIPADLEQPYRAAIQLALQGVAECFERAGRVEHIRLHGDCHMGNVLWTDAGPHFVDFDDSRMGPAIQDLWMMLSGSQDDMRRQLQALLDGYEDFHDFNPAEVHLIEALRTLRLIHYAGWLAMRWTDPAFPRVFSWFNTQQYWQDRILELREQIALMQEPPIRIQRGGNF
ncbi:MAG TPA: serine/threonine protein kinase [Methylovorus sp.]|jgi:Ser/Thr protein kinase RdoA (MazF antagonist)|nr:serine/threonine protein kinase [Methylovorus sp.]